MNNNSLKYKNGEFTILQVSDAQDMHYPRKAMLKMLDRAYDTVRPDLVLLTGDNILGNHLLDARIGNRQAAHGRAALTQRMEKSIAVICKPLEQRKIPFAMIFGNHDDMNELTKDEQLEIYKKYSCFTGLKKPDGKTCTATYNLPIFSTDSERIVFNLWLLDSAWQDKATGICHTGVTAQTVEWYRHKSDELKKANGGAPIPSLMFQHIPFPESARLIEQCKAEDAGAIMLRDGSYIRLDPEKAHGVLGEPEPGCEENHGQFEAMKEQGDVIAAVFGHHHLSCFEGRLDGIDIIQTSCASFRCYGSRMRGVRVFELDESKPAVYSTHFLTYFDLCGTSPLAKLRYLIDAD